MQVLDRQLLEPALALLRMVLLAVCQILPLLERLLQLPRCEVGQWRVKLLWEVGW
jgi:hypothetical protein